MEEGDPPQKRHMEAQIEPFAKCFHGMLLIPDLLLGTRESSGLREDHSCSEAESPLRAGKVLRRLL